MTENTKDLLTEMRCEVVWTHKATMPIPLYERIKAALQEKEDREAKLVGALRGIAGLDDVDGNSAECDSHEECQLKAIRALKELGIDV